MVCRGAGLFGDGCGRVLRGVDLGVGLGEREGGYGALRGRLEPVTPGADGAGVEAGGGLYGAGEPFLCTLLSAHYLRKLGEGRHGADRAAGAGGDEGRLRCVRHVPGAAGHEPSADHRGFQPGRDGGGPVAASHG